MNIFILDKDPVIAAQSLCDKHVVKMALESAQMLCSIHEPGAAPYRRAFYNHPCTKWARKSKQNYQWLIDHGREICLELLKRYTTLHKSYLVINWAQDNINILNLPNTRLTSFALAMPEDCKRPCAVESYRLYYRRYKYSFATWKRRSPPNWWIKE